MRQILTAACSLYKSTVPLSGTDELEEPVPTPTETRRTVAAYVEAVHTAYLTETGGLEPGLRARLPLLAAGTFRVAAVAAGDGLHLIATEEPLEPAARAGARMDAAVGPLTWMVLFFDPSVLPALGGAVGARQVRRALGVTTTLYHLSLPPPVELSAHHALHTGTGLAAAHLRELRALEEVRAALGEKSGPLLDELAAAMRAGLRRAQALLAHALVPDDPALAELASSPDPDPDTVWHALVAWVRRRPVTR